MEEKNSQVESQSLEQKPSSQVDFVFSKSGTDSSWVDELLSQERILGRLTTLRTKCQRKIGVAVGNRGPSAHEIKEGTPENNISRELTPGDYLIFLPGDFLTRFEDDAQTVLIHEIAHLRKGFDDIDNQLIRNRQEVGKFMKSNPSIGGEGFALLAIAGYIFNYLIDYRLLKWQVGQGELQDALEFADRTKRTYERDVSRKEELKRKDITGELSLEEALEAYHLDLSLLFNISDVYLTYIAPFESLPQIASKKGEDLIKLFERAKMAGQYITDNSLTPVLSRAKEVVGLVDSGIGSKKRILETVFGKGIFEKMGASELLQE